MQVNAISSVNSYSNVNFGKRNKKEVKPEEHQQSGGWMTKLAGPAAAAMFMVPVVTSCYPDIIEAHANAAAVVFVNPGDGCHGCDNDTVYIHQNDTIYLPPKGIIIPQEIMDSLNYYRKPILDVDLDGDKDNDGSYKNQVLLSLYGLRDWDYKNPEHIRLNLYKTNNNQAVYNHVAVRSGEGFTDRELKVTKANAGDVKVVRADGSESDKLGGMLFEENGKKFFAHSNGRDSLYLYKFVEDGVNAGKYESIGQLGRGYLPEDKYGENFLLDSILGEGTEDHMIKMSGLVMEYPALIELYEEVMNQ